MTLKRLSLVFTIGYVLVRSFISPAYAAEDWTKIVTDWPVANPDALDIYLAPDGVYHQLLLKGNQYWYRGNFGTWQNGLANQEANTSGQPLPDRVDAYAILPYGSTTYATHITGNRFWLRKGDQSQASWQSTGLINQNETSTCGTPLPSSYDTLATAAFNGITTRTITKDGFYWYMPDASNGKFTACGKLLPKESIDRFDGGADFIWQGKIAQLYTSGGDYYFFPDANNKSVYSKGRLVADTGKQLQRRELVANGTVDAYARQISQLNSGIYDPVVNKTFVVYSGGRTSSGLSEMAPHIITFDHKGKTWSAPQKIAPVAIDEDSHYYPQITLDNEGYLHVLHSFHNNHNTLHAVSKNPHDPGSWTVNYIPNSYATYGALYTSSAGHLYYLHRRADNDPNSSIWLENLSVMISKDNGSTWTNQVLIDPTRTDGWSSIYLKSVSYQANPEGLHLVFSVHKRDGEGEQFRKTYYSFFKFSDNAMYSAAGKSFGPTLSKNEFGNSGLLFLDYGRDMAHDDYGNGRAAVMSDASGKPIILVNQFIPGKKLPNVSSYLTKYTWNGTAWQKQSLSHLGIRIDPFQAEYFSADNIDVYAIQSWQQVNRYHFDGKTWKLAETLSFPASTGMSLDHFNLIANYNPEVKAVYYETLWTNWDQPKPVGKLYAIGEKQTKQPQNKYVYSKPSAGSSQPNPATIPYSKFNLTTFLKMLLNREKIDLQYDYNQDGKLTIHDFAIFKNNTL